MNTVAEKQTTDTTRQRETGRLMDLYAGELAEHLDDLDVALTKADNEATEETHAAIHRARGRSEAIRHLIAGMRLEAERAQERGS